MLSAKRELWKRAGLLSRGAQASVLVGLAFLLMLLRKPSELLVGYFYAEEGATYFHYAWNSTAWRALLAQHQGYYSLYPNAAMLLAARVLPPQFAAAFGAWCGLAIVLLMVYLAAHCELFTTPKQRVAAALVCLLAPPSLIMTLSTINSQYFLAVCTAIILVSSTVSVWNLKLATLIVSALTGAVSCIFFPFFAVKAILERSKRRAVEAGILLVGGIIQTVVIWGALESGGKSPAHHPLAAMLDAFFISSPVMEFGSRIIAHIVFHAFTAHYSNTLLNLTALVAMAVFPALVSTLWSNENSRWLVIMGLFSGAVGVIGAIDEGDVYIRGSIRYLMTCNILIGLSLLHVVIRGFRPDARKVTSRMLLLALFLAGFVDFAAYRWTTRCEPAWPTQIMIWQADQSRKLALGPHDWGYTFSIAHIHPLRADLPTSIYDTVIDRRAVLKPAPSTPCTLEDR